MRNHKWFGLAAAFLLAAAVPLCATANLGGDDVEESKDPNLTQGRKAIDAKDWKTAVDLLSKAAAAEPKNPDVHNWLGFAQRKSGNMQAAFASYNEALKLNPKHKAAHEYIGEAYLITGDVGKAEQHLAELQKLCSPIPCEEYKDLRRAVEDFKKNKK